jgi:hypothetical protein
MLDCQIHRNLCNPVGLHPTLGYLSPKHYEAEYAPAYAAQYVLHRNPPFLGHRSNPASTNMCGMWPKRATFLPRQIKLCYDMLNCEAL